MDFNKIMKDGQAFVEKAVARVKTTDQKEWGVLAGSAFLIQFVFYTVLKSKDDSMISLSVILNCGMLAVLAVIVRDMAIENQYSWSIVGLNVIGIFSEYKPFLSLFLGIVPTLVIMVRDEIVKRKLV